MDGRANRRNKAAFSNFSGLVLTLAEELTLESECSCSPCAYVTIMSPKSNCSQHACYLLDRVICFGQGLVIY